LKTKIFSSALKKKLAFNSAGVVVVVVVVVIAVAVVAVVVVVVVNSEVLGLAPRFWRRSKDVWKQLG
jgi:hypothetical protein